MFGFSGYDNWLSNFPEAPDLSDCYADLEAAVRALEGTDIHGQALNLLEQAENQNWRQAAQALTFRCEEEIPVGLVDAYYQLEELLHECESLVTEALYRPNPEDYCEV